MEKRRLRLFEYWDLGLHRNQSYLGRSVASAIAEDRAHVMDMTKAEREELFDAVVPTWHSAVSALFPVARPNVACLANNWRHLHWHLIPRYEVPVLFEGVELIDPKPTKNYSPTPPAPDGMNDEIMQRLRDALREAMS